MIYKPLVGNLLSAFGMNQQADRKRLDQGYQSLLGNIKGLQGNLLGQIDQTGQARTGQINQDYTDTVNNSRARLSDRGIGGSTFDLTAGLGAQRNRQTSLNQLSDNLLGQKMNVQNQLGQYGFGVQEKSFQPQTDPNFLMQLLGSIGQGQDGLNATIQNMLGGQQGFRQLF